MLILDAGHTVSVSDGFGCTYRTHKAGVVPGESQSLQELVPGLDGEVAAVAVGSKQAVVVCVSRKHEFVLLNNSCFPFFSPLVPFSQYGCPSSM